jgi:hypothetical protein
LCLVPNASRLSILDCHFGFLWRLHKKHKKCDLQSSTRTQWQ